MAGENTIIVTSTGHASTGRMHFTGETYDCALGRSGMHATKREGDGITPTGIYALRSVLYRPDRVNPPETTLAVSSLGQNDGWCDDPNSPAYNQPILLPSDASAEHLWREDHLYDVIVVLGHNDDPVIPGAGSAIFMHVASDGYGPTEGCIALAIGDLQTVLAGCNSGTTITIGRRA
jgi:L,D-peptidoglycan transpeptidase YkuD (ErfK/YbiS/YcfS/YnhG family)